MIEHLGNCHGEITFLMSMLAGVPFVGNLVRRLIRRRRCACGDSHNEGERHA